MRQSWLVALLVFAVSPAWGAQRILRVYQSPRAAAMGGTRVSTCVYEDCLFSNPARLAWSPNWRLSLLDASGESNIATFARLGDFIAGKDIVASVAGGAGDNIHMRGQTFMPAVYVPRVGGTGLSLSGAMFLSSQFDINLRKSYLLDASIVTDAGPVFSAAYAFLKDQSLSIGLTVSGLYRFAADKQVTMVQLLQGQTFGPTADGKEGVHIEMGMGAAYRLPKFLPDWDFEVALSAQNLLGGTYDHIPLRFITGRGPPIAQPRAFGVGVAARVGPLWKLDGGAMALEFLELGNDGGGSFWRHIHLGTEWRIQFFMARLGINQGYPGAGVGFDLKTWNLDFSFYGEELGLNAGDASDYRIALRINLQI